MATSNFNLEQFKSLVFNNGLARTNRFEVIIPPPPGLLSNYSKPGDISLLLEQSSFPLLNIATKGYKIFGPTYQRPITSEYGGEGIAMTFHVDSTMEVKRFFEDWMHLVVNPFDFTVGYQEEYITSIFVSQLDEQNNITHEIEILEAFPRNMNIMELNNASANQTHRLTILFAYRYWKEVGQKQPEILPRSITTPQLPSLDVRPPPEYKQWNWSEGSLSAQPGSSLPPAA